MLLWSLVEMKGYLCEGWFSMKACTEQGAMITKIRIYSEGVVKQANYPILMEIQNFCPAFGVSIGVVGLGRTVSEPILIFLVLDWE